ncbi:MAG: hypothetical protein AAGC63_00295 [Propionicimonas sp.]|nr:hypothetical protein [Propionicimonas sp.]
MDIEIPVTFTQAWPLLLPFVALLLQAVVNQPSWTAKTKRWIAVGMATLMGVVYLVASGLIAEVPVAAQQVVVRFVIVVVAVLLAAQAVYSFLKPVLDKIEVKTAIEAPLPDDDPAAELAAIDDDLTYGVDPEATPADYQPERAADGD